MFARIFRWMDNQSVWSVPVFNILAVLLGTALSYPWGDEFLIETFKASNPRRHAFLDVFVEYLPWLFGIVLFLNLVVLIVDRFKKKTVSRLESDLSECQKQREQKEEKIEIIGENIESLFNGYLLEVAKDLGFGTREQNTERVTIYIHTDVDSFVPFGRYSANPYYNTKNRAELPDSEGCVSAAWKNGWCFENDCEPPRGKPRGITSGVARVQAVLAPILGIEAELHPQGKPCGFTHADINQRVDAEKNTMCQRSLIA